MCPDKNILSIYYDRELPSPFKEKVKEHIGCCQSCARTLAGFADLAKMFTSENTEITTERIVAAQARIWQRLEGAHRMGSDVRYRSRRFSVVHGIWRREVRLSLPVAAAACVAIFVLMLFLTQVFVKWQGQNIPEITRTEDNFINVEGDAFYNQGGQGETVNVSNIRDVLQFLENDGDSSIVIIKLPESKNFFRYGEPKLINASDHPRSIGR